MKNIKNYLALLIAFTTLCIFICIPYVHVSASNSTVSAVGLEDNNHYFIKNHRTNRLMAPNSGNTTDIVTVLTWDRNDWENIRVKWELDEQTDGRFKIWSFNGTGKNIRAYTHNGLIEVEYDENDDSVKFQIERSNDPDYRGLYTIKCGDYYFSENPNNQLVTLTSGDPTEYSYWSFISIPEEGADAEIFYFTHTNMNTSSNVQTFVSNFDSYGYDTFVQPNFSSFDSLLDFMMEDEVTIFAGYGSAGCFDFNDSNGNLDGCLLAGPAVGHQRDDEIYISNLSPNALSGSRCIIYLSSNSAVTYNGCNLVEATYEKGAACVIGVNGTISNFGDINTWLYHFLDRINHDSRDKRTIAEAVSYANGRLSSNAGFHAVVYGDGSQVLNFN